jgi:hypothetical protein
MFLYKKGKFVTFSGEVMRRAGIVFPQNLIKLPFGNLYWGGERITAVVPELFNMTRSHRQAALRALVENDEMVVCLGYLIDVRKNLYMLYTGGRFINAALTLSDDAVVMTHFDGDHDHSLYAAAMISDTADGALEVYKQSNRNAPAVFAIHTLDVVVNEMVEEGRTGSLLEHLTHVELKGQTP